MTHPCSGKSDGFMSTVPLSMGLTGHGEVPFLGVPLQRETPSALLTDISLNPSGSLKLILYFVLSYCPTNNRSTPRVEFPGPLETMFDAGVGLLALSLEEVVVAGELVAVLV